MPTTKVLTKDETLECVEGDLSYDLRESHEALRAETEALGEKVAALNKRIDALQKAKPAFLTDYQRMWDLVRYQRAALLDAGLITREEFALLIAAESEHTNAAGSPSPRRLESYDEIRSALTTAQQDAARLREALEKFRSARADVVSWAPMLRNLRDTLASGAENIDAVLVAVEYPPESEVERAALTAPADPTGQQKCSICGVIYTDPAKATCQGDPSNIGLLPPEALRFAKCVKAGERGGNDAR